MSLRKPIKVEALKKTRRPEEIIQDAIIRYLLAREWFVRATHGNQYQSGFPDLFAAKRRYGQRWIEVKNPESYKFTPAQLETFPKMSGADVGIWILTAGDDREYKKLFNRPNWFTYLPVWGNMRVSKIKEYTPPKRPRGGPEMDIQTEIVNELTNDGWLVRETYGCMYQTGFPDVYACKKGHGQRWIEIKNPKSYRFTPAQMETFPRLTAEGVGIWILTSASQLDQLDGKPNWMTYV